MQTKFINGIFDKITVVFIVFFLVAYLVGIVAGTPTEENASATETTVPIVRPGDTTTPTVAPAIEVPSAQPKENKQKPAEPEEDDD